MGTITDIITESKESVKPQKTSFKQKFKESFFAGSKRIGRGIKAGAKVSGRFAAKKGKEFVKEQIKFRKQKKTIVKKERLRAFKRDVRASLTPPKQIKEKQIQQKQVQTFPNLLGKDNKKMKLF